MGRGKLVQEEIEELRRNPYVVSVDSRRIRYSEEFKKLFIWKYINGERPSAIFRSAGFDTAMLGSKRIERACARWREMYCSGALDIAGLEDGGSDTARGEHAESRRSKSSAGGCFEESDQIRFLQGLIRKQEEVISRQRTEIQELKAKISENR